MSHRVAQKLQLQHYNVVAVHAAVVTATKKNCAVVTAGNKIQKKQIKNSNYTKHIFAIVQGKISSKLTLRYL